MDPPQQQHYRFFSDYDNDIDHLIPQEQELSEIMMSIFANQENNYGYNGCGSGGDGSAVTPNHYVNYGNYGDLLHTTSSSSSESDCTFGLSPAQRAISNPSLMTMTSLEEKNIINDLGCDGMFSTNANYGLTTSFSMNCLPDASSDVANCYWLGGSSGCLRQPAAAPVVGAADNNNYSGAGQLCNNEVKVGQYTAEERKDRILRYLKKRNQRNFNKTIKYACRKTLADRRVRVRGRFARNSNESSEEERTPPQQRPSESNGGHHDNESYKCNEANGNQGRWEGEEEDDEWLQEAVASLLYAPYNNIGTCNVDP
ncbi:Zinc finger protein CONSTANS-LIKE 3 [Linum perenne]